MTGSWRLFLYALDSDWRRPLGIFALTALNVAAMLMVPWPLKWIIDDALGQGSLPPALASLEGLEPVALIAVLAGLGLLLRALAQSTRVGANILGQRTGQSMKLTLAARAFDHLQQLDHGFFIASRKGDLSQRLNGDCAFPGTLLTGVILPTITAVLTMAAVATIMWGLSPTLAVAMIVSALPIPFAIRHFQKPIAERSYRQSNELGDLMSLAEQTLTSMPVIQGFNRQGTTDEAFRDKAGSLVAASMAVNKASVQINVSIGLVQALATAMAMVIGGYLVIDGVVTVGTLVVMLSYLDALYGPIGALAGVSTAYAACIGKARRVGELLGRQSAVRDRPDAIDYRPGSNPPEIALQDVSFGYVVDSYVLDGVSVRIRPGEVVALIGTTGAGKSTLASLLTRAIDPSRGAVLIDGSDLRRLRGESLRQQIGVVLQDGGIVPGTVAENISMFDTAISQAKIEEAARIAQADRFIEEMDGEYDAIIGTGRAGLSGGQKQRIAIARAVAKDAPVLILDEPTSALDVETEAKFFDALTAAARGRTTLIITHRVSTLRLADRVLRLEDGKLTEIPPEEVLRLHTASGGGPQG